MAPQSVPVPAPPSAEPAPPPTTAHRVLLISGYISLGLTLATLLGCAVLLFVYLAEAVGQATIAPPELTGSKDDYPKLSLFMTVENYRQQARIEQRAAVLRSCGLLTGVAVTFVALTLFLAAARMELETTRTAPQFGERLARVLPAMIALACATAIITFAASESRSNGPPSAGYPYAIPQYAPALSVQ